ncbi:hypothetical protein HHE92_13435 [Pseudoalteromonas arctica]|uniref:hypothetical protein n=1 Tax=Pseudoalteromonas arctica TaxID=394751 RepID=UPI00145C3089|nr:hypothetical protein [Pseudoalteromonas arctica]NMP80801.1 hypothetical protein [Pseudoalteromonas arctica]
MEYEELDIRERTSERSKLSGLIISAKYTDTKSTKLAIGRPGTPNLHSELELGDAVIFETPDKGTFEIRNMALSVVDCKLLITQISRNIGIGASFIDQDESNLPFNSSELGQISESIEIIKRQVKTNLTLESSQLDLIYRKLDEIKEGSEKFGRKDWLNMSSGIISGIILNATLDVATASAFVEITNSNFGWLFSEAVPLLLNTFSSK